MLPSPFIVYLGVRPPSLSHFPPKVWRKDFVGLAHLVKARSHSIAYSIFQPILSGDDCSPGRQDGILFLGGIQVICRNNRASRSAEVPRTVNVPRIQDVSDHVSDPVGRLDTAQIIDD